MDSTSKLPLCGRAPSPPPESVRWGLYPRLDAGGGVMKEEMGEKIWLGLFPQWGLGASGPIKALAALPLGV